MDRIEVERAAAALVGARSGRKRLGALPAGALPASESDAYRIQEALIDGLGARRAGWKIGATSAMAQTMLGVGAPFAGRLLAPLIYDSPAEVPAGLLFMRGLEVEVAFRMAEGLAAPDAPFDRDAVAGAVAAVHPAIEIVDSRYLDWTGAGAAQTVADNAAHGAWVHGAPRTDIDLLTCDELSVAIAVNAELKAEGVGGNALGHPLNALTWLAHELARKGEGLKAGDYVSTGTCTATVRVEAGDHAVASFGPLGEVEVTFA